jgi:hypothetical protein
MKNLWESCTHEAAASHPCSEALEHMGVRWCPRCGAVKHRDTRTAAFTGRLEWFWPEAWVLPHG